ncbi:hypothetical protein F2P56_011013 [Juglans regia]|uniref:Uncharacterized protein n=1 Tax=Juglans regia TaxID=51240 RepID=A0A833XT47_JUGRE|nr:hypothetical protein F2P56_011013 [Juglans regia]
MICTNTYLSLPPPIPVLNTYSKARGQIPFGSRSLLVGCSVICLLVTEAFGTHSLSLSLEYLSHCSLQKIKFLVSKLAMASIIEYGWLYLITHFSDFQLACLGSFFLHESVFFLSGLPFIYLERAGWLSKYKIQTKNNSPAAQEKCVTRLLLYHFGVNLPVMIISYPVFKYMGMRSSLPLPSWYFQGIWN